MNMKDNIINYLCDKNYLICIYDNYIYIFNYSSIKNINSKKITLTFNNFILEISGQHLYVKKLTKYELLIQGKVNNIGKLYE